MEVFNMATPWKKTQGSFLKVVMQIIFISAIFCDWSLLNVHDTIIFTPDLWNRAFIGSEPQTTQQIVRPQLCPCVHTPRSNLLISVNATSDLAFVLTSADRSAAKKRFGLLDQWHVPGCPTGRQTRATAMETSCWHHSRGVTGSSRLGQSEDGVGSVGRKGLPPAHQWGVDVREMIGVEDV